MSHNKQKKVEGTVKIPTNKKKTTVVTILDIIANKPINLPLVDKMEHLLFFLGTRGRLQLAFPLCLH